MDGIKPGELCSNELYERYCEYTEASRTALLSATVSPETRRSIAMETPCLPRNELERSLRLMNGRERQEFFTRINVGYEQTFEDSAAYLKKKYLRTFTQFNRE